MDEMKDMEKPIKEDPGKDPGKEEDTRGQEKHLAHPGAEHGEGAPKKQKRLKAELERITAEAKKDHDRFLRKCAELENYKKRIEKEKKTHTEFANEDLIRALLPIIDNLERALQHSGEGATGAEGAEGAEGGEKPNDKALASLRSGLRLTLNELYSQLKVFGLEALKAEGERFDPSKHEAISHEETSEVESDIVISELRRGYFYKDRLIRPALVIVSKKPEGPKEGAEGAEGAEGEDA